MNWNWTWKSGTQRSLFVYILCYLISFEAFGDNGGGRPENLMDSFQSQLMTLSDWAARKIKTIRGEGALKQGEILLNCEKLIGPTFLTCLGNQATLNFAVRNDPHFAKTFSDRKDLLQRDEDLRDRFKIDGDYQRIFEQLSVPTLYQADSGVSEGYSVGAHTSMALLLYETQKSHFRLPEIKVRDYVKDLDRFMKYLVAFHDIGKGFSAAIYPKERRNRDEIIFSYPLAWRLMLSCGFSESEARLAILLIHVHKIIGDHLVGKVSAEIARIDFSNNSRLAGIDGGTFFRLAEILFVVDAGSYPNLRSKIFVTDDQTGKLTPKDQNRIDELRNAIRFGFSTSLNRK
ncbi:MAG: hypothetical protein JNM39_10400 [Bdellovibrionaceae bacterium]|nr:hypothetical protein [Pseudobdellovibrionaceae bacterium]